MAVQPIWEYDMLGHKHGEKTWKAELLPSDLGVQYPKIRQKQTHRHFQTLPGLFVAKLRVNKWENPTDPCWRFRIFSPINNLLQNGSTWASPSSKLLFLSPINWFDISTRAALVRGKQRTYPKSLNPIRYRFYIWGPTTIFRFNAVAFALTPGC